MSVALITGSAQGIGLATADLLLRRGWTVAGVDLLPAEDPKPFALHLQEDLTDSSAPARVVDKVVTELGSLEALVNNAAFIPMAPFLEATETDLERALSVNVRAAFLVAQAAARHMVRAGHGGSIVNLGSVNGERGVTDASVYSLTKGAIATLTRTMAVELASHGIRVNTVAPGPTGTAQFFGKVPQERIESRQRRIPFGRLGDPGEIASAIAFLLSEESAFVSGMVLPVDGGYLAFGT